MVKRSEVYDHHNKTFIALHQSHGAHHLLLSHTPTSDTSKEPHNHYNTVKRASISGVKLHCFVNVRDRVREFGWRSLFVRTASLYTSSCKWGRAYAGSTRFERGCSYGSFNPHEQVLQAQPAPSACRPNLLACGARTPINTSGAKCAFLTG